MLDRIAELLIFGFAPMVIGIMAIPGESHAAEKVISGEVLYRERIALPPNAALTVELVDVSRADAPATVIGKQIVTNAGQVPIQFEIRFDPSVIQPNMSYALQARIEVDAALWFITDERHSIDPLTAGAQTVRVTRVSQTPETSAPSITGVTWLLEDINGAGVIDFAQSTFAIDTAGKVSGRGACNSYFSTAELRGNKIAVGEIGSTFMACAEAVMNQEKAFFDALRKVASFRMEAGKLVLLDASGHGVLLFAATS